MVTLCIDASRERCVINKNIYGHFAEHLGRCIYGGVFVGEESDIPNINGVRTDVALALKKLNAPVLRWPGGCFADEYHWEDGVGPKENRKKMVNTHWGGAVEDNSFGTHEFMELCSQVGCEPYVNANLGSGTVRELSDWVEYMTYAGESPMSRRRKENGREEPWRVKYLGIGNENWGCGGSMRPEYYADEYRRYQTYARDFGENKLYKIACGANAFDYDWTEKVMASAGRYMDALTLHYYTIPSGDWSNKGSATVFTDAEYYSTVLNALKMDELIRNHLKIIDRHDPERRVGLIVDEWGTWYDVEPDTNPGFLYQQNTMRDAVVAAATLNIFNGHAGRLVMANLAQTVNVLQAVILTDGPKMLLTPTYHVFEMYKAHQGATSIECDVKQDAIDANGVKIPGVSASASVGRGGELTITAVNFSLYETAFVRLELKNFDATSVNGRVLSGPVSSHNTFDAPDAVAPIVFPAAKDACGNFIFTIPPNGVAQIEARRAPVAAGESQFR